MCSIKPTLLLVCKEIDQWKSLHNPIRGWAARAITSKFSFIARYFTAESTLNTKVSNSSRLRTARGIVENYSLSVWDVYVFLCQRWDASMYHTNTKPLFPSKQLRSDCRSLWLHWICSSKRAFFSGANSKESDLVICGHHKACIIADIMLFKPISLAEMGIFMYFLTRMLFCRRLCNQHNPIRALLRPEKPINL